MNKVIKVISNIFLWFLLIILVTYIILKITNIAGIYKVLTGSMEPKLHAGDYILVLKTRNYKKGDIVTYSKEGYYITHRIVKINNKKVITKGDANNTNDEEIKKNKIIGKCIYKSKMLNFVINYKFFIISIFLLIYLISLIISNNKGKEENQKE